MNRTKKNDKLKSKIAQFAPLSRKFAIKLTKIEDFFSWNPKSAVNF